MTAEEKKCKICKICNSDLELFFPNPIKIDTGMLDMASNRIFSDVTFDVAGLKYLIFRCPKCGLLYAFLDERFNSQR